MFDLSSEQNIIILATTVSIILISVVGLLFFRRHRKTNKLKQLPFPSARLPHLMRIGL
jgi:signal transduction histidine kinase